MDETRSFWTRQEPLLENMLLRPEAEEIDRLERPEILSYLPDYKGLRVLDLASGIGRFTRDFAKKASQVTALDISPAFTQMNRKNNRKFTNIKYVTSDAMDVQFAKSSFDLVFVSGFFMYLTEAEMPKMIQKIRDWTAPGGHLFFRESCSPFSRPHQSNHAQLRPFEYYQNLIEPHFTLLRLGSVQSHIQLFGDPFRCFWLFQKNGVEGIDK